MTRFKPLFYLDKISGIQIVPQDCLPPGIFIHTHQSVFGHWILPGMRCWQCEPGPTDSLHLQAKLPRYAKASPPETVAGRNHQKQSTQELGVGHTEWTSKRDLDGTVTVSHGIRHSFPAPARLVCSLKFSGCYFVCHSEREPVLLWGVLGAQPPTLHSENIFPSHLGS